MANNSQLNTPPNTGPTKPKRTSVKADFELTPEEHIEWMTELGQDQAILRQKLDEMNEKLWTLERRLDSAERIQRQIEISHCRISNLTINTHPQVQEFQQTQRQHQASPLQNLSLSGVETAGNTKTKSDSQSSKPDIRIKAESTEL